LSVGHFAAREACYVVRGPPGFVHKMRSSSRTELLSGLIDIYSSRFDRLWCVWERSGQPGLPGTLEGVSRSGPGEVPGSPGYPD